MSIHKPFSRDEFPDLTKAISEIVAPKKPEEKKKTKPDKWGGKEPYVKNDRNPYTAPHKVQESHTRAALEKLSTTRLRELLKQYSGKPGSGRELADIRGLLRARGAGVVVDEGFEADERAAARSARVRKWMGRLKKANAADLKDKPGAAGEAAHKRLHKTIAKVVGEGVSAGRAPARKPTKGKKPDPHAGARGEIGVQRAVQKRLQKYGMRW